MKIRVEKDEKCPIVSVKGRMDAVTAPDFEKQVSEIIEKEDTDFIIDLAELEYISSAGLRSILAAAKKLKQKERQLYLAALQDVVKEVFEISGFSAIIPIFDSVETVLKQV
jgi:anti-anti-sigma factor